jgi:hypothetical protein
MRGAMNYTAKIDQLLAVATQLGFTEQDFADLALAAADQSGATTTEQACIAQTLGIQTWTQRECATYVGVGRIRDGETNHLRRCLDGTGIR